MIWAFVGSAVAVSIE